MSDHQDVVRLIEEKERKAYERGYNDAVAAITDAAVRARPAPQSEVSAPIEGRAEVAPATPRPRGRPATIINSVKEMIGSKPGLTGAEIVRALEANGTPVLDRSMRSCLRRLKDKGEIWQRSKRWYPKTKKIETVSNDIGEVPSTPPH